MWEMSPIEREDLSAIAADRAVDWNRLAGKTVLVSGATGLIGRSLIKALLFSGSCIQPAPRVIALVRDVQRAEDLFAPQLDAGCGLRFHCWSAEQPLNLDASVDFIFHCASQTSSSGFVQTPVETIRTAYLGTEHILSFAAKRKVEHMVFLSTMEVYGTPQDDRKIDETYIGEVSPLNVRSCYPESKRLCENLCVAYANEYAVPVSIARLTQTFGPGVSVRDGRVFAEFARCVMDKRDIVLKTKGETKRNYLYTADAVRALIILALFGQSGQAYNIANEDTYCTILEMAQMVAREVSGGEINVRIEVADDIAKFGYAPVLHMNLDTGKLRALGWQPEVGLQAMFQRMIAEFRRH